MGNVTFYMHMHSYVIGSKDSSRNRKTGPYAVREMLPRIIIHSPLDVKNPREHELTILFYGICLHAPYPPIVGTMRALRGSSNHGIAYTDASRSRSY
ncbi:MAG: hypothetical protein QXN83_09010 [Nitrososphaerales archaeon]